MMLRSNLAHGATYYYLSALLRTSKFDPQAILHCTGTKFDPGDWSLSDGRPGQTSPSSLWDQPPPSATVLLVQRLSSVPTHHEVRRRLPRGYALCARGGGVVPPLLPACALAADDFF